MPAFATATPPFSTTEEQHPMIVYLPLIRSRDGDGQLVMPSHLTHCATAKEAKRAAQKAAGEREDFAYDKVEYRGRNQGVDEYGPTLSRWSTGGKT
jgi:hypothetical protein